MAFHIMYKGKKYTVPPKVDAKGPKAVLAWAKSQGIAFEKPKKAPAEKEG